MGSAAKYKFYLSFCHFTRTGCLNMSYLMSEHVIRAGPWDLAIRWARILVDLWILLLSSADNIQKVVKVV